MAKHLIPSGEIEPVDLREAARRRVLRSLAALTVLELTPPQMVAAAKGLMPAMAGRLDQSIGHAAHSRNDHDHSVLVRCGSDNLGGAANASGNPGGTVLIHKQPDDIWRVDYQLREGESEADALKEENLRARVGAILKMAASLDNMHLIDNASGKVL